MGLSHDVRIWNIRVRKDRPKPYMVRWKVGTGPAQAKSFTHRPQADSFRSRLVQASRSGEAFDEATGLPSSELREQQVVSFYELAVMFVDLKWPHAAAKTRTSTAAALATVTPVLVSSTRGKPDDEVLRAALYGWAFHKTRRDAGPLEGPEAAAVEWLAQASLKVNALDEPDRRSRLIRGALDRIALRIDGSAAAATTIARKRAVFYGALNYAVELDLLAANPIDKVSWKAPKAADQVDRRLVAGPKQVAALLEAVAGIRPELVAFFGCLYYATMRPGESVALERSHCEDLPETGWGLLTLSDSHPRVGSAWTDSGDSHDRRQLKHRAQRTSQPVPIPPELVELLRHQLERHMVADNDLLFRGARGGPLSEIARRAGHGVEVLLRVYAGCIDGQDQRWNDRIGRALTES